jgi:hypothetical protein
MNAACRQFESMPPDINESDWRVHGADPGLLQGFSRALAVFILDLKSGKKRIFRLLAVRGPSHPCSYFLRGAFLQICYWSSDGSGQNPMISLLSAQRRGIHTRRYAITRW